MFYIAAMLIWHANEDGDTDTVVEHALLSIGQGRSHVVDAYDYVAAAADSGAHGTDVEQFLKLGSSGKHPSHIERDLFDSELSKRGLHLQPYDLWLTLDVPDAHEPQLTKVCFLLFCT